MMLLRRLARPLLASVFVSSGADTLRNPGPTVDAAEDVAPKVASRIPALQNMDTATLMRINGGAQVIAGSLLALNRLPRLSALTLAGSVVPATAAGHRFWQQEEGSTRKQQRAEFYKNLSIVGGLLIAAGDTEGKPSLRWRTRYAAERAGASAGRSRREVKRAAKTAKLTAKASKGPKASKPSKAPKASKASRGSWAAKAASPGKRSRSATKS